MTNFELFLQVNNLKQKHIVEYLNTSKSCISQYASGKLSISEENLSKLINNPYGWDTSMLINQKELDNQLIGQSQETQISTVKLLPQLARGGSLSDFSKGVMDYDCEIITSPVRGAEFAIQITGDSMAPEYPSGSRVLIQKVNERAFIEWGKVYVLDTVNGVVVKEVRKTDDPDVVQCCSINPDPKYQSYTIETKYIIGWYRILMMMSLK